MAELQALNRQPMTMADWIEQLHRFLSMTGRELLTHAGSISHDAALEKAHDEYARFRQKLLMQPTEVERHFVEAEQELKRIASKAQGQRRDSSASAKKKAGDS